MTKSLFKNETVASYDILKSLLGTSLEVQLLKLRAFITGCSGLIDGRRARSHLPHGQKKKSLFKDDIAQNLWGLLSANFQFSTQNLSFYCKLVSISRK